MLVIGSPKLESERERDSNPTNTLLTFVQMRCYGNVHILIHVVKISLMVTSSSNSSIKTSTQKQLNWKQIWHNWISVKPKIFLCFFFQNLSHFQIHLQWTFRFGYWALLPNNIQLRFDFTNSSMNWFLWLKTKEASNQLSIMCMKILCQKIARR